MSRLASVLIVGLAACASWPEPYWPGPGWREVPPEAAGMDSRALDGALDFIESEGLNIHNLLVIRGGYVVMDAAYWPYRPGDDHDVASVTKSVVATMVGRAMTQRRLALDDRVLDRVDREIASRDPRKGAMRIEDLLTMRAGLRNDEMIDLYERFERPDWVRFTLDRPMAAPPGTVFNYDSGLSHVLATLAYDPGLLDEIGMPVVSWPTDPQGQPYGGGDLHVRPRDLAKLGLLYLRRGHWRGQSLLGPGWVADATRRQVEVEDNELDYGYHWWVFDGGFTAVGRGGQYLAVVPEADLIVVAMSGAARGRAELYGRLLREHILAAVRSAPRKPGAAAEKLGRRLRALQRPPEPKTPTPLPDFAREISGVRWQLETEDPLDPQSFEFTFDSPAVAHVVVEHGGRSISLAIGLDGVPRVTPRPPGPRQDPRALDLPSALQGSWWDDRTFVLEWDEINNINRWTISFAFDGDSVRILADEATFHPSREWAASRTSGADTPPRASGSSRSSD